MNENNNFNQVEQPVTPVEPVVQEQVVQQPVEPQIDPSFGTNVSIPVQPVPEATKKKSKLPIILIIIIILSAACFGGSYYYFFVMNKDNKTPETTAATNDNKVTDKVLIDRMNDLVRVYKYAVNETDLYKKDTFKLEDKELKRYIAALNTDEVLDEAYLNEYLSKAKNLDPRTSLELSGLILGKRSEIESTSQSALYKEEDINKVYKDYFNEDMTSGSIGVVENDPNNTKRCPAYMYDSTNKVYLVEQACGGDDGVINLSFVFDYEHEQKDDNDYYYAYIAVGYIESQNSEGETKSTLHYGYLEGAKTENIPTEEVDYEMNSSNYNKFDKFRYVFIKDKTTGSIYVDHVEVLKDVR